MGLSWQPRRRGHIYCAPACGADCTWEEYQRAKQKARELILRLARHFGDGFKPRIWENGGWHYEARRGTLVVGQDKGGRGFYAYVTRTPDGVGGRWWGRAKTPRGAVMHALQVANAEVSDIERAIAGTGVRS